MNKIMKWLKENNIEFTYTDKGVNKYISIMLDDNAIWVNGYGKEMKYQKTIGIRQDTYKTYYLEEVTGYNRTGTLAQDTKADIIIKALANRFEK